MRHTGFRMLPLLTGILPILTVNSTYLIAAAEGHVPWCVPYWDSCTSISATGRAGTAFWVFKLAMVPIVYLYICYWMMARAKLHRFSLSGSLMFYTGTTGALFLAIHSLALGLDGDTWQTVRRIGINIYFACTYLAQLQNTSRIYRSRIFDPTLKLQLALCILLFLLLVSNIYLNAFWARYDNYEDAFAWISLLLVHSYFFLTYWSWKLELEIY